VSDSPAALPADLETAHALIRRLTAIVSEQAEAIAHRDTELARLETILKRLQRLQFGQKSERLEPDQLALGLEDIEGAIGAAEAAEERLDATLAASRTERRRVNRGQLPAHLPRIEELVDVEDKACPCCGGALHVIGEDRAERLDVIPAQFRVLVTRRPKYACRACTDGVVQAHVPPRLIEGGIPTEATVALVLTAKYADHLPLYRQSQIWAREGVEIDRSTMADWVGRAAFELKPLAARLHERLKSAERLFCDETPVPVLDPGRGKTKKGYLWAIARDDRPWGGTDPPGVVYLYTPGRNSRHAIAALQGFEGVAQVDGYGGYNALTDDRRKAPPIPLAFCWAHWRRKFFDLAKQGPAPIATEMLERTATLYAIEADIRGRSPDQRRTARQQQSQPLVEALFAWLSEKLERAPKGGDLAKAIRYGLSRREGLTRFLTDGRLDMDTNTVERAIRPITLNRKNALFAGSDEGGHAWAAIASLVETCKLNGVDPYPYLRDTLEKLVRGWPASRIDDLLPWAYVP